MTKWGSVDLRKMWKNVNKCNVRRDRNKKTNEGGIGGGRNNGKGNLRINEEMGSDQYLSRKSMAVYITKRPLEHHPSASLQTEGEETTTEQRLRPEGCPAAPKAGRASVRVATSLRSSSTCLPVYSILVDWLPNLLPAGASCSPLESGLLLMPYVLRKRKLKIDVILFEWQIMSFGLSYVRMTCIPTPSDDDWVPVVWIIEGSIRFSE